MDVSDPGLIFITKVFLMSNKYLGYFPFTRNAKWNISPDGGYRQAAREAPPTTRLTGLGSGSASGNGQPRRSLAPTSHYGSAPCGVASAHRESFRSKI